ncbi:MAG: hypothetical protein CMK08_04015 [Ponticaulis sp.]|nr:hypothetical protein [Ponticaulis sp.]
MWKQILAVSIFLLIGLALLLVAMFIADHYNRTELQYTLSTMYPIVIVTVAGIAITQFFSKSNR